MNTGFFTSICSVLLLSILTTGCPDSDECVPSCGSRECGSDGCGGFCQPGCEANESCEAGTCVAECVKKTCVELGKNCGDWDDGCQGTIHCGDCQTNQECGDEGTCECQFLSCESHCCSEGDVCNAGGCCKPVTCESLGFACGHIDDGCGTTLDCGLCGQNQTCNQNGQCECVDQVCAGTCCASGEQCHDDACCAPKTCQDLGVECGLADDGCGNQIECGSCTTNAHCNQGQCVCPTTPCGDNCCQEGEQCIDGACCKTCELLGKNCGSWSDGCGGMINCGSCDDNGQCGINGLCECLFETCESGCCDQGQVCSEGVCCNPQTCADLMLECGSWDSGCGTMIECGGCPEGKQCNGSGQCECEFTGCDGICCAEGEVCFTDQCCLPSTCQDQSLSCGSWSDNCGGEIECGGCPDDQQCNQSGSCECAYETCLDICCAQGQVCFDDSCCQPYECDSQQCGSFDDGCGGVVVCECGDSEHCATSELCEINDICVFPDPVLDGLIRQIISKSSGDILPSDVAQIKELSNEASGDTKIESLQGLGCLVNLESLELKLHAISDLGPIAKLINLTYINLFGNNITDISALSNLVNVNSLILNDNNIEDASALANMKQLLVVFINQNQLESLDGFAQATNMILLSASDNNISNIDALANLTALDNLNLSNNNITDISALSHLVNMRTLYLPGNQIVDISKLAPLILVDELDLSQNAITNIDALAAMENLSILALDFNPLTDLAVLANLTELVSLQLIDVNVADISVLAQLQKLKALYLNDNGITDVNALRNLSQLHIIYLEYNLINDIEPLYNNPGIGEGDVLTLLGNPLMECADPTQNAYMADLKQRCLEYLDTCQ